MNIDQRLHRASHDLREIDIEVPPLRVEPSALGSSLRRLGAPVATAMIFVLGAVGAVAEFAPRETSTGPAVIAAAETVASQTAEPDRSVNVRVQRQLSAHEEIAMISALSRRDGFAQREAAIDLLIPSGAS